VGDVLEGVWRVTEIERSGRVRLRHAATGRELTLSADPG
jgi:hypothetical protein